MLHFPPPSLLLLTLTWVRWFLFLQVLKWNFTTPRPEFIELLKQQMEPTFNRTVIDQLFHVDFKFQIRAMDTLIKVIIVLLPSLLEFSLRNLTLFPYSLLCYNFILWLIQDYSNWNPLCFWMCFLCRYIMTYLKYTYSYLGYCHCIKSSMCIFRGHLGSSPQMNLFLL